MTCPARIAGDGDLLCQRLDEHTSGHVYMASDAPDLPRDEEAL